MRTVRFDPLRHPRNRLGQFIEVLGGLRSGDKVRLPGGVEVAKGRTGLRVNTPKPVTTKDTKTTAKLALNLAGEAQGEIDVLADEISEIPREWNVEFDTPRGPLSVTRSLASDPDGWEFNVTGRGVDVGGVSAADAAEVVVRTKREPKPPASPGTAEDRGYQVHALASGLAVGDEVEMPGGSELIMRDSEKNYVITDSSGTHVYGEARDPDDLVSLIDELEDEAQRDAAVDRAMDELPRPRSPGASDAPLGRIVATEPFSFRGPAGDYSVSKGDTLDVLRRGGTAYVVRTPDAKGVALVDQGDVRGHYERLPAAPRSPGTSGDMAARTDDLPKPQRDALHAARATVHPDYDPAKRGEVKAELAKYRDAGGDTNHGLYRALSDTISDEEARAIGDSVKREAERKRRWADADPNWNRPATPDPDDIEPPQSPGTTPEPPTREEFNAAAEKFDQATAAAAYHAKRQRTNPYYFPPSYGSQKPPEYRAKQAKDVLLRGIAAGLAPKVKKVTEEDVTKPSKALFLAAQMKEEVEKAGIGSPYLGAITGLTDAMGSTGFSIRPYLLKRKGKGWEQDPSKVELHLVISGDAAGVEFDHAPHYQGGYDAYEAGDGDIIDIATPRNPEVAIPKVEAVAKKLGFAYAKARYSGGGGEASDRVEYTITARRPKPASPAPPKSPGTAGEDLASKPLYELADEIRKDWKDVNFAAKPYLDALDSLDSIEDNYGMDSAKTVVAYFLSNASRWRGPKAKEIKAELKRRAK